MLKNVKNVLVLAALAVSGLVSAQDRFESIESDRLKNLTMSQLDEMYNFSAMSSKDIQRIFWGESDSKANWASYSKWRILKNAEGSRKSEFADYETVSRHETNITGNYSVIRTYRKGDKYVTVHFTNGIETSRTTSQYSY